MKDTDMKQQDGVFGKIHYMTGTHSAYTYTSVPTSDVIGSSQTTWKRYQITMEGRSGKVHGKLLNLKSSVK